MAPRTDPTRQRFRGRVAVLMGAARGIGAATGRAFAHEGADVVLCDVLEAEGERTAQEIVDAGGSAVFVTCDVSRREDVRAAMHEAVDQFSGIDVLFNNVGITRYGPVDELDEADWDKAIATNLTGTFLACRYAIPSMRERGGGAIINTASVLAHVGRPKTASYAAAKGGILALSRAIAIDHGHEGIRCNSISPGTIDTPLVRIAAEGIDRNRVSELVSEWGQLQVAGRIGRPEEVAALVLYLASDEAAFVTGSDFAIDGGLRALQGVPER